MNENENIAINESTLLMYINDELSDAQRIVIDKWLLSSKENLNEFNQLKKSWELSGKLKSQPVVVNTDDAWKKVLGEIKPEETTVIELKPGVNRQRMWWSIAAALLIALGIYGVLQIDQEHPEVVRLEHRDTIATGENRLVDTLKDGSVITLNENSVLSYDQAFGETERRVQFKGEAFFDIERDEEKPFVIGLEKELHVKVLGTSFNIDSSPEDSLVEVYVKTGKVEFGTDEERIILVAGEKGLYRKSDGQLTKVVDELEEMKSTYWMNESLEFDGTLVADVVEILNAVFDSEVILNCETAKTEPFRSSHTGDSLESILDVISDVNQLRWASSDMDGKKVYTLDCNEN